MFSLIHLLNAKLIPLAILDLRTSFVSLSREQTKKPFRNVLKKETYLIQISKTSTYRQGIHIISIILSSVFPSRRLLLFFPPFNYSSIKKKFPLKKSQFPTWVNIHRIVKSRIRSNCMLSSNLPDFIIIFSSLSIEIFAVSRHLTSTSSGFLHRVCISLVQ